MHSNFVFPSLLLFSLIFLFSCDSEPIVTNDANKDPNLITTQSKGIEASKMKMRDGVPVLPEPGSQIEDAKVDSILEIANMSFSDISPINATEKHLKKSVEDLNKLLHDKSVIKDKELQFTFHTMLGYIYGRLLKKTKQQEYVNKAKKHFDSAILIFKNQPEYKVDLASAYMGLTGVYIYKKEYDKAISLIKNMIEEYQNIGFGLYDNWFAARQVQRLFKLAHNKNINSKKTEKILDYIQQLSGKYDNEVGIMAQITLVQHYFSQDKQDKVAILSASVENRLVSLNNPVFKKNWESVKMQMERSKNMETSHNH